MEGSVVAEEDLGAPDSWEVADLDQTMNRLSLNKETKHQQPQDQLPRSGPGLGEKVTDDVANQVDQFLLEALQNTRERLSSEFFN
jgi:hypothetical protein